MNREIKFRGMTIGGFWVEGNLSILKNYLPTHNVKSGYYISNKFGMPFAYPVRPETVGQSTGLKDKNDIKIYEGDIVKGIDGHNIIIENMYDAFYYISMNQDRDCFEIIGNIHEKPELLENK